MWLRHSMAAFMFYYSLLHHLAFRCFILKQAWLRPVRDVILCFHLSFHYASQIPLSCLLEEPEYELRLWCGKVLVVPLDVVLLLFTVLFNEAFGEYSICLVFPPVEIILLKSFRPLFCQVRRVPLSEQRGGFWKASHTFKEIFVSVRV